ncbi:MAG: hypothetical protein ACQEXJ_21260 [Myxococcota bacterium]
MFRLLLSVIFFALTLIGAIVVYLAVNEAAEPLEQRLESGVQISHQGYGTIQRLRDLQMRDLASGIAESRVQANLSVLTEYRDEMLDLEAEVYEQFPGDVDDETLHGKRRAWVAEHAGFLDRMVEDLAARMEAMGEEEIWADSSREEWKEGRREALEFCSAIAVSNCFFRLTYFPLKEITDRIRKDDPYGIRPDFVVVTDERGTGLADVTRPKWSDDTRFAERYPLVRKTREGVITRDVIRLEEDDAYYFVTAAPMFDGDAYRGSVLAGVEIDDGLLEGESRALGWKVSYFDGKKLIRSSLTDRLRSEMLHNLPPRTEEPRLFFLRTEHMVAQFVPVTGNYTNADIKVAISGDREAFLAPIDTIESYIWLYGALMFLIGMGLFTWVIRTYTKPLVEIDSGIHEIITGNRDYEFRSDYRDQLWSSMAQSLNRMVGILLGRKIEEDELEEYMGVQSHRDEPEGRDQAAGE